MAVNVASRSIALAAVAITLAAATLVGCSTGMGTDASCRSSGVNPPMSLSMTVGSQPGSVTQQTRARVGQELDVTMNLPGLRKPVLYGSSAVLCVRSTKTTNADSRFIVLIAEAAGTASVEAGQPAAATAAFGMTLVVVVNS
jgi:hypothetical protein